MDDRFNTTQAMREAVFFDMALTIDAYRIEILEEQAASRVPELVPIRYGRMMSSPFAFFRGTALLQAHDLAGTPASGIEVHACGDCHLMNFGGFASPLATARSAAAARVSGACARVRVRARRAGGVSALRARVREGRVRDARAAAWRARRRRCTTG